MKLGKLIPPYLLTGDFCTCVWLAIAPHLAMNIPIGTPFI